MRRVGARLAFLLVPVWVPVPLARGTPSSGFALDPQSSIVNRQSGFATPSSGLALDTQSPPLSSPILKRPGTSADLNATPEAPWYRNSFVALVIVLGLILLVSYGLRRYVPAVRALGGGAVQVLQRTPLTSKQGLALVQVGRRMVLIGVTPSQLCALAVIEDPEECAHVRARADRQTPKTDAQFETFLSLESGQFAPAPLEMPVGRRDPTQRLQETKGHLEGMLQRLRGLRVADEG